MAELEIHPTSNIFPLMDNKEYETFKADIASIGLLQPICLHPDGRILDGRNRYKACLELGIEPRFETWNAQGSLVMFVISMNLHRRHLNSSQKAVIAMEIEPILAQEAKERQRQAGGDKKSETAKKERQTKATKSVKQKIAEPMPQARDQAAKIVGTNKQYVSDVKKIKETAPEKIADISSGEKTISQVKQEMKKEEKECKRQEAIEKGKLLTNDTVFVQSIEKLSLEKESVDLIITDPPYADKDVKTYEALAQVANECLKPGSFCCCYTGKLRLPDVLIAMTKHLQYVWCIAVFHPFSKEKHLGSPYQFAENWRPVLVFKKDGKPAICNFQQDVVRAERNKDFHDWQQDLQTPSQLIEAYTDPEGLVVDPFCGGGTTLVAAKRLGRRWLGFDASEESVALSKQRLYGTD